MKLFLRVIFFSKIFEWTGFAITSTLLFTSLSANKIYPQTFIEPGNRWDYIEGWWDGLGNGEVDSNCYTATTDTLLSYGKYYYRIYPSNELFNHYIRIDTSGIWYYDFECNTEWLYFSYTAAVGTEILIPKFNCDTLEYAAVVTKTDDTSAVIFNDTVRLMTFQYVEGVDGWYSVTVSPKYGFIHWYSASLYENYYKHLMGCILSGVTYGNLITNVNDLSRPKEYALKQNYPNPFNPSTTISYSIPARGKVRLIVYDALGRVVIKLIDEEKDAGNYKFGFNTNGLASGVYFYQLRAVPYSRQAGSFVQTKKMILMK